ncbi:MAG: GNAT family N-acetyltransferase [Devosia sp.]|uniref:GNAT family N-acetyltransferase n=1 Tax=Devosia sp. TaxID=1871048 RepID=UPI0024C55AD1|nr:GNAT family N-acetyltransferase [Devosia sp.]UYN98727.1 MAG: GNAT family N-acetyltransferase [Devosia sp.]
MTIVCKRLGPEDAAILGNVAEDVFDEPIHPQRVAAYLAEPGHLMVVALDGDLVVGQCAGVVHRHPDKPDELYVDEVGTATSHLRQGIGRAMMAELFAWGREIGCVDAWLGTELDNAAANDFYRALGGDDDKIMYYEFKL